VIQHLRSIQGVVVALVALTLVAAGPIWATSVEYEVTFDATWSSATHPQAIPAGAHFSPLIGATHNDQVTFWQSGEVATPGIERMAETGGRSTLQAEIDAAISAGNARSQILGSGTGTPNTISMSFEIDSDFPLVTLVTMIAPSPDWFVGVAGVNLRENNNWIQELTLDLLPYDAGTDSGTSFTSPNLDTNPRGVISRLGSPFDDTTPLGTITFTLVPEPDGFALLAAGVFALLSTIRSRAQDNRAPTNPNACPF